MSLCGDSAVRGKRDINVRDYVILLREETLKRPILGGFEASVSGTACTNSPVLTGSNVSMRRKNAPSLDLIVGFYLTT